MHLCLVVYFLDLSDNPVSGGECIDSYANEKTGPKKEALIKSPFYSLLLVDILIFLDVCLSCVAHPGRTKDTQTAALWGSKQHAECSETMLFLYYLLVLIAVKVKIPVDEL